jgi:hypothetical protein
LISLVCVRGFANIAKVALATGRCGFFAVSLNEHQNVLMRFAELAACRKLFANPYRKAANCCDENRFVVVDQARGPKRFDGVADEVVVGPSLVSNIANDEAGKPVAAQSAARLRDYLAVGLKELVVPERAQVRRVVAVPLEVSVWRA